MSMHHHQNKKFELRVRIYLVLIILIYVSRFVKNNFTLFIEITKKKEFFFLQKNKINEGLFMQLWL